MNPGHCIPDWTIGSILKVQGIEPAPPRRAWQQKWLCPRCSGPLKIISLIGNGPMIETILRHLKLWHRPERPPPRAPDRSIQYDADVAGSLEATLGPDAVQ
jgi:hypothetical protein